MLSVEDSPKIGEEIFAVVKVVPKLSVGESNPGTNVAFFESKRPDCIGVSSGIDGGGCLGDSFLNSFVVDGKFCC